MFYLQLKKFRVFRFIKFNVVFTLRNLCTLLTFLYTSFQEQIINQTSLQFKDFKLMLYFLRQSEH